MPNQFALDTLVPASSAVLLDATARFAAPVFWGRYFHAAGNSDYNAAIEGPFLRANGIPVLPIARQTNRVSLGAAEGGADGTANAGALIAAFTAAQLSALPNGLLVFLDVESGTPLTQSYYAGWSQALQAAGNASDISLLPALYASSSDASTWGSLTAAVVAGSACGGVWVAHWPRAVQAQAPMPIWPNAGMTPPAGLPPGVNVLAWQFGGNLNGSFDGDQTPPDPVLEASLLGRLIVPS